MSTRAVREDDEENKAVGGSGLGLAVAAGVVGVGLGIGAALYYFFKPDAQEPPHGGAAGRADHTHQFRERAWTLEQCSICFEAMLPGPHANELLMLPCGHKFHFKCVEPWTRERNTCPNCRKAV